MTEQLRLRPVEESDIPVMEALQGDPDSTGDHAWFGFQHLDLHARWAANGFLGDDGGRLMVAAGDRTLGFMAWTRRMAGPAAGAWHIGIAMLPQARGQGHGTEAHRLLVRYLFAHTPAHRIEADTEAANIAEQRALEKAGFTREGVLRGHLWRDGAWRDYVLYSILRTDPPA
jgi:RimJ/RimL family protein N-acetyltransferase